MRPIITTVCMHVNIHHLWWRTCFYSGYSQESLDPHHHYMPHQEVIPNTQLETLEPELDEGPDMHIPASKSYMAPPTFIPRMPRQLITPVTVA